MKRLLGLNIAAYIKKNKLELSSIFPKTFYIGKGDYTEKEGDPDYNKNESLEEVIEEIESKYSFNEPWIIKPGEMTNRGIGIKMAFGKEDMQTKVSKMMKKTGF